MAQKLRAVVELEVPDQIDLDALKTMMAETFAGRVRFPEDEDLVVFFRPNNDSGDVEWGTVPPAEVVRHCTSTANALARPVEPGEVYYNALGEVLAVAGRLYEKSQG